MYKQTLRFFKIICFTRNLKFALNFSKFIGSTNSNYLKLFDVSNSKLTYLPTNSFLLLSNCAYFLYDLNTLFFAFNNFQFSQHTKSTFVIEKFINNRNVKAVIRSKEDYELFVEIFHLTPYSFTTTKECVLLDVGMNIGFASLYFSTFQHIKRIYSFELIEDTFKRAIYNFQVNEELENKIEAFSFGLSDIDKEVKIPFAQPGSVGASIFNISSKISNNAATEMVVNVKNICPIITSIVFENQLPLIIKLDCEGSEYDLINALESADLFKHIHILMIEWHYNGSASIVKILAKNGFVVFDNLVPAHMPIGFIYAVNRSMSNVQ
jgi:FkbM family methyltransferase